MKIDREQRSRIAAIVRDKTTESNILVAKTMIVFSVICFAVWVMFRLELLMSKGYLVNIALIVSPVLFLAVSIVCLVKKGKGMAFQYIFFALFSVFWLEVELMSGYKSKLLLPVLIILTLRYYNIKFTVFGYFTSLAVLFASVWCNAYLCAETGFIDLNVVSLEETYELSLSGFIYNNIINLNPSPQMLMKNGLILTFMPCALFMTVITVIAIRFMKYNLINIHKAEVLASREANQRLELADMKTKVMLTQIKPHFLYNTLSSIAMLCTKEPAKAKALTLDFSDYLRNNLDTIGADNTLVCSFETELEHIKTYLNIESVRFGDRLHVEYDIRQTEFPVPVLSIQPIVENAVKHGVCGRRAGGTVRISSEKVADGYLVTVEDDGIGFDKEKIYEDGNVHIGLKNIENRIKLFNGVFNIESVPGEGTKATVLIRETEGQI